MRKTVQTDYFLGESESMALTEPITPQKMRDLEAAAIASGAVTGLELMERAGQGVLEAIFETWPDLRLPRKAPHRAVILCGPGNNGGDGFVVARLLAERGWDIDLALYGDPDRLPPDAQRMYDFWSERGDVACSCDYDDPWAWCDEALGRPNHVFVDALFGIGLKRPLSGVLLTLAGYVAENRRGSFSRSVAIDVPSGLDAETGAILGHHEQNEVVKEMRDTGRSFGGFGAFTADLTVTFHRPKPGHLTGAGRWMCGKLVVKDIGL